jgi:hypothetical protein
MMDAHKLKITWDPMRHLEKENDELEEKLHSQEDDLWQSIETIEYL